MLRGMLAPPPARSSCKTQLKVTKDKKIKNNNAFGKIIVRVTL